MTGEMIRAAPGSQPLHEKVPHIINIECLKCGRVLFKGKTPITAREPFDWSKFENTKDHAGQACICGSTRFGYRVINEKKPMGLAQQIRELEAQRIKDFRDTERWEKFADALPRMTDEEIKQEIRSSMTEATRYEHAVITDLAPLFSENLTDQLLANAFTALLEQGKVIIHQNELILRRLEKLSGPKS